MTEQNFYIHGHSDEEQTRLSKLNDVLNPEYLEKAGPWNASRILDVGCGLGHVAREIKRRSGNDSLVIGIDRDDQQLAAAKALTPEGEVQFRKFDIVQDEPPPDWQSAFDIVHARFLLEHVPKPEEVVRRMASCLKHGGRMILADDDHSAMCLFPAPGHFAELWSAYEKTYLIKGNDPFIGRKLIHLMSAAEIQPVQNGYTFFGSCAGHPHFSSLVSNLAFVISGAKALIEENNLMNPRAFDLALHMLRDWSTREDAAIWYPLFYAAGIKTVK